MRFFVLAFALLVACGPRDVVVVDLPPDGDGGFPGPGKPCEDDSDCMHMDFCAKATCGAPVGRCKRPPLGCSSTLEPVCGCNNVNYWNDCVREAHGIPSSVARECVAPVACGAGNPCPTNQASCALLLSSASSCSVVPTGVCWVTPPTCPAGDTSWESCSGPAMCGGFCAAIRSGAIRRQVNSCP